MDVDALIAFVGERAGAQHGLIRVDQVPEHDRRRLRHLADRRIVERVVPGVYRVSGAPPSWVQSLQAGIWALGPTALVSHNAAAGLHGLDGFHRQAVEFCVDRIHRNRSLPDSFGAVVHSTDVRDSNDRRFVSGLPVTSPERTIVDLARSGATTASLEAAVDSALRLRLATLDQLVERVRSVQGAARWGLGRLDSVLVTSGGHSLLERRFLELVRSAGLSMPVPQVVHRRDGRHVARVDFLFEGTNVVVEVSGGRGHSSAADRANDARRRNDLQQMGRTVLEFTYEMVLGHGPRVLSTVRDALSVSRP